MTDNEIKSDAFAQKFNLRNFLKRMAYVYIASYIVTFIFVGILWDPNGVLLFKRPISSMLYIIGYGFFLNLPLAASPFSEFHPITLTILLGLLACWAVGFTGIHEKTGQRLLYVLLAFTVALGTVQFCLMA